jgi:endonuclease/exonuclease/phosphatase family metal-dependent hydrolase
MITSSTSRIVTLIGCCAMTAGMGFLIFSLQPFGLRWPTFVGVAATLVVLQVGRRPRSLPRDSPPSNMRGPRQSIRVLGRRLLSALCLIWLCLIAWAEASPGRVVQPPPRQPEEIRVVTWNILRGCDGGPPWLRGDWSSRKPALATALEAVQPDILCVQEALPGQLCFLEQTLPNHHRVGAGRDDGKDKGEHCAIFFDRRRFEKLADGTFWLEEPTDQPASWRLSGPKRICTWVSLHDQSSGGTFRVCNTHLYLTEPSRQRAARLILDHLRRFEPAEPIVLAGDFNATESAPSRRLFTLAGLESTAELARVSAGPTYQFYGIQLRGLDEILADSRWIVHAHLVLDVKPDNRFPSDHFGVMADLILDDAQGAMK